MKRIILTIAFFSLATATAFLTGDAPFIFGRYNGKLEMVYKD